MATKGANIKDARFDTRLQKEQKDFFERAARLGGFRNLTDFVIVAVQEKAKEIIDENRGKLEDLAQALEQRETLDAEEVAAIIEGREPETVETEDKGEEKTSQKPAFELGYKAQENNKDEVTDTKGKLQLEIKKFSPVNMR